MLSVISILIDRITGIFTLLKIIGWVIVGLIVLWLTYPLYTMETETVTVIKTERVNDNKESQYLIYTDKGVYKNVDQWRVLKFDSSDLYGKLQAGKTFKIKNYGFRWTWFDVYPNITSAEEVTIMSKVKDKLKHEAYKYAVEKALE